MRFTPLISLLAASSTIFAAVIPADHLGNRDTIARREVPVGGDAGVNQGADIRLRRSEVARRGAADTKDETTPYTTQDTTETTETPGTTERMPKVSHRPTRLRAPSTTGPATVAPVVGDEDFKHMGIIDIPKAGSAKSEKQ